MVAVIFRGEMQVKCIGIAVARKLKNSEIMELFGHNFKAN